MPTHCPSCLVSPVKYLRWCQLPEPPGGHLSEPQRQMLQGDTWKRVSLRSSSSRAWLSVSLSVEESEVRAEPSSPGPHDGPPWSGPPTPSRGAGPVSGMSFDACGDNRILEARTSLGKVPPRSFPSGLRLRLGPPRAAALASALLQHNDVRGSGEHSRGQAQPWTAFSYPQDCAQRSRG